VRSFPAAVRNGAGGVDEGAQLWCHRCAAGEVQEEAGLLDGAVRHHLDKAARGEIGLDERAEGVE